MSKLLWKIVKRLLIFIDRRWPFMAYSMGIDENTTFYILAERCYPDRREYGVTIKYYDKEKTNE